MIGDIKRKENSKFGFVTYSLKNKDNEVKGVNRIVHDVTSKPPSIIEWK